MAHLVSWPFIVLAGLGIGTSMGIFGVGGSSVATPVLALLGAPALIAVASPLPAAIPSAAVGALPYVRAGEARPRAAAWSILGGVPATIGGALLSRVVGGASLLVASGVVLIAVGLRVLWPIDEDARSAGTQRRQNRPLLVAATAGVGLFTGLLANGGAFLLVPLYLLMFGLRIRQAVGTSLLVITALSVPTLVTHWALGHIDWALAGEFALGLLPGSAAASRLAHRIHGPRCSAPSACFSSPSVCSSPPTGSHIAEQQTLGVRLEPNDRRRDVAVLLPGAGRSITEGEAVLEPGGKKPRWSGCTRLLAAVASALSGAHCACKTRLL